MNTLWRMPLHDATASPDPQRRPPAADDEVSPNPDLTEPGIGLLVDLIAASLGLFVAALGLLIACGWLTTAWGAGVLGALLLCPVLAVLVMLLRQ